MLTKVLLTVSEMASYASNQAMFLQPSKFQGVGIHMLKMQFCDALGQRAAPWGVFTTSRLRCFSEFEGRWEHACWRVFWPVANLQLNYFAPDNQRVRLLRIMPTALMLCILPRTVTSEISVVEARILVTIYTKLLGFCSARCCKIFPKLYNEWT